MPLIAGMPSWVNAAYKLQAYPLVNRGVMDALGTAGPVIGLARNPQERREKILDRVVVIGSAFVFSPLHAWALMKTMAKSYKLPSAAMGLSFAQLNNKAVFQQAAQALPKLAQKLQSASPQVVEALRQSVIKAKTSMLIPDLTLECLIFGGVGWITNFFTRLYTGKNRFSGEVKATSEENLKALYEKEKGYQKNEKLRLAGTLIFSFGMPLAIGLLLKRAVMQEAPKSAFLKWLKPHAKHFDYKNGIWMSMPGLFTACVAQLTGHLLAARNKRELKESFIRENMLNAVVFLGHLAILKGFSHVINPLFKLPKLEDIKSLVEQSPAALKKRAGRVGALNLLASLVLNSGVLASIILFNNYLTQRRVDKDVAQLGPRPLPQPKPSVAVPVSVLPTQGPYPLQSQPVYPLTQSQPMPPPMPVPYPAWPHGGAPY